MPEITAFLKALNILLYAPEMFKDGDYKLNPTFDVIQDGQQIGTVKAYYTITFSVKDGKVWAFGVIGDHDGQVMDYMRAVKEVASKQSTK